MKKNLICCCIFLCIIAPLSAQIWQNVKNTKHPESVKEIEFCFEVGHMYTLPSKVKQYVNVEILNLCPPLSGSAKPVGGPCVPIYGHSRIKYLPDWISTLKKIQRLDLMNAFDMDYMNELPKISKLPNLEYLRISPSELDDELLRSLSTFTQLKELCIMPSPSISGAWGDWFNKLRLALPNCKVDVC